MDIDCLGSWLDLDFDRDNKGKRAYYRKQLHRTL